MALVFIPGFYTKVRIDDEGHIVDVGELEASDLPKHEHTFSEIVDASDEIRNQIVEVLSTFFANSGDTAVKFTYDKNTKTISADVNIDDESIQKNEFGQLISAGGSGEGGSSASSSEIERLNDKLEALENRIPTILNTLLETTFANTDSTAIDFIWDKKTGTLSADVNIDGVSIEKDEFGNLKAVGLAGDGESGNCATHTHTSNQIEDFEEAVVNIFNDYSKNIDIDFKNYIDGTTIKINEYGQLTAVRTALEKHTHVLADIIDYEAAEVAAKQMLADLGEEVDLSDGVLDFTNLNIGYSILALNKYLQDVVIKNIANLTRKINALSIARDNNGQAILSIHSSAIKNKLYDKQDRIIREVYYADSVYLTLDYLPYDSGTIELRKDSVVVDSQNIQVLNSTGQVAGRFAVEKAYTKNAYVARILKIDVRDLLTNEDSDSFQVDFITDTGIDHTNVVTFYSTPNRYLSYKFEDISNKHEVAGVEYYDYPKQLRYKISINDYSRYRFVNTASGFVDGAFTGIAEQSKYLQIEDLFETTSIQLKFLLEEEYSTSPLRDILSVRNGEVLNDLLVTAEMYSPDPYTAIFRVPNSEFFNSLKIDITDPNFSIADASIEKGDILVPGTRNASDNGTGTIKLSNTSYVLTLGRVYDSGKDAIKFIIKTNRSINLHKIHFTPIDFY